MQTINVRTTQNVFIEYPIASIGDRIVAGIIDIAILLAYLLAFIGILIYFDINSNAVFYIGLVIPSLLYHLMFEVFMNGQSPGKRVMGIKVVRIDGTSPTIGNYVMRWLLGLIENRLMMGMIAIITIVAASRGQRLGDMAANTTVVKTASDNDATASEVFTLTYGEYTPKFQRALELNDRDVELIQQALHMYSETGNATPLNVIGGKLEAKLGVTTDMEAIDFLECVVRDYTHLSAANS